MSECSKCGYSGCIDCGKQVDPRVFRCDPCLAEHERQFPTTTPAEQEKVQDIYASFVTMGKEVGMVEQPIHAVEKKIISKLRYYRIYDALMQAPDAASRIKEVVTLIDVEASCPRSPAPASVAAGARATVTAAAARTIATWPTVPSPTPNAHCTKRPVPGSEIERPSSRSTVARA
jgi:hypothetical protein